MSAAANTQAEPAVSSSTASPSLLSAVYNYDESGTSDSPSSEHRRSFELALPSVPIQDSTSSSNASSESTNQPPPEDSTAAPSAGYTAEKSAYFAALRTAVVSMQADINAFLTERMEADSVAASANAIANGSEAKKHAQFLDDAKEEENYGEEIVE